MFVGFCVTTVVVAIDQRWSSPHLLGLVSRCRRSHRALRPVRRAPRSRDIYVRPAARIVLPKSAVLTDGGAVSAAVRARCDEPWTPGDYLVSASQAGGTVFAQVFLSITCDGRMHTGRAVLQPVGGAFTTGRIQLDAELTVFDEFFDPVAQARASRSVRVVG